MKRRPDNLRLIGHVVDHVVSVDLSDGSVVRVSNAVPPTRADCPSERPCPHVRCEHNLAFVDGRDRPGRRHHGKEMPPTLRLEVLKGQGPSCELDVIDKKGALPARDVAVVIGVTTQRRVEQITKRALEKLKSADVELPNPDDERQDSDARWPAALGYGRGRGAV